MPYCTVAQAAEPAAAHLPLGQFKHAELEVEPVLPLYLPATQSAQSFWPVLGLYLPAAQVLQPV